MKFPTPNKITTTILYLIFFIHYSAIPAFAQQPQDTQQTPVLIEMFGRDDCSHCKNQREFLKELSQTRNDFTFTEYDITQAEYNALWLQLTSLENIPKVTPITLIGNTVIQGFGTSETTGKIIQDLIDRNKGQPQITIQQYIDQGGGGGIEAVQDGTCDDECIVEEQPLLVSVPIFGAIDVKQYSLPVMSIILGFIDGFNPCAMWVLVTFLIVLVQIGDRKKMWLFAGTFILAEAIMYTLILTVWFTTWDFVGLDRIVPPIVGLIAVGGGFFFLWEYWQARNSDAIECKVGNIETKRKTTARIKQLATGKFTIMTFIGILTLAFSVNVIEFACSIGIPQAFTKILELNGFTIAESSLYIFLYILFYMVDDFIVFGIALYSFEKIGLTSKYTKWSNLIGGILMVILGFILIINPDLLTV